MKGAVRQQGRNREFNVEFGCCQKREGRNSDCSVDRGCGWVLAISHTAYFSSLIFSSHADRFSVRGIQFSLMGHVASCLFLSWT